MPTIDVDDRVLDAIEDVAKFCMTFESHFTSGWRDDVETFDDLWYFSALAFYGDALTTNKKLKADEKVILVDEHLAFSFMLSQVDYQGRDGG